MNQLRLSAIALLIVIIAATGAVAHAQTFSVLYNFGTKDGDPLSPQFAVVAQGRDGNTYSTAPFGGANDLGAVFKITPAGKLAVLYNFDGTHGSNPYGGLTLGTDGNFYGTAGAGGTAGFGTVFKITPGGSLKVLYNFTGGKDGMYPVPAPIQGSDGNFYGTTEGDGQTNLGTVYKITLSGTFKTLYQFDGKAGEQLTAALIQATDGNFYSTASLGGMNGFGTVFKISPAGKVTVLHNFNSADGSAVYPPVMQASDGNFYGVTTNGGSGNSGVVYQITPKGKFKVLYNFGSFESFPLGGLVQATDGFFYGTTGAVPIGGGSPTIFRINKKGQRTILYDFKQGGGINPQTTLLQHTNGILYGDDAYGGTGSKCGSQGACGAFFSLNEGLKPFVSLVSTSGIVGNTIGILGQGFTGTTGVSFNGTSALFKVSSDTYLTATVPSGTTTGL